MRKLFGKIFGDKGYIFKPLYDLLCQTIGVQLITKLKSNAKNRLPMEWINRILIRKRILIP